jgi:cytochrome c oxidase subunit 1
MFAVGMGPIADSVFSLTTMLIAIPTGVKIFNWISTMWGGALRFTTAMLFAIALVGMFTIGGISGVMHSSPPADLQQTDTYFVVAHFHYVLFGGSMFGIFAGIYYYFPKMFGRMMNETLGKWHFWGSFIAMNLTFFPMHFSGLLGMPRRIYQYDAGQGWDTFNMMSSIGAIMFVFATSILIYNFFRSMKSGPVAGNDPWGAPTIEWAIPSPPPDYNFQRLPTITSRYPMWDMKSPQLTAEVPHTVEGDKDSDLTLAGKDAGHAHLSSTHVTRQPAEAPPHVETGYFTATELGIPMPNPTAKPFVAALAMVVMISGMLFMHRESKALALAIIFSGAAVFIGGLYAWLTTPLEDAHH